MIQKVDLERLSRELTESGKLIEAGWIGLRLAIMAPDASETQISEMRKAFFAGAQHLFSSVMTILEPGSEASEADLKRMDLIHYELEEFIRQFKEEHALGTP